MASSPISLLLKAWLVLSSVAWWGLLLLISIGQGSLAVLAQPAPAIWTELVGPDANASIRTIVPANRSCPILIADDTPTQMRPRTLPNEKPNPISSVQTCEYVVPDGTMKVTLEGKALPLPHSNPQRIVVFGDTGCRQKQDCANSWDYPDIAKNAAEAHPDLVIHVGDYVYRDRCDSEQTDCEQWSVSTGWDAWEKDFFNRHSHFLTQLPGLWCEGITRSVHATAMAGFVCLTIPRRLRTVIQ